MGKNEWKKTSTDILTISTHSPITKYQYFHTSDVSIAMNHVKSSKKDDKKSEYEGYKSPKTKQVYSFNTVGRPVVWKNVTDLPAPKLRLIFDVHVFILRKLGSKRIPWKLQPWRNIFDIFLIWKFATHFLSTKIFLKLTNHKTTMSKLFQI